jgi:hypothetical protein
MPVYQNKALQDQIMRVATQGQQRSINSKARQAAVAKAIGSTGQVAAQAYSANAAEVMKQAKELGLSSPEEIAGLKKVMEISERTGLTVEEITGSPKLMEDLMNEAKGRRARQDSLDKSISGLEGDLAKSEGLGHILSASEKMYGDQAEAALNKFNKTEEVEEFPPGLQLPKLLAGEDKDKKISTYRDTVGTRDDSANETARLRQRLAGAKTDRKANVMSPDKLAKLKALQSMGLTRDQLTAARRSISAKQKLDKLASSNLVGRDMVGRMAAEGSRTGMKEITAQKAAAAQLALTAEKTAREVDVHDYKKGQRGVDAIGKMSGFAKLIVYANPKTMGDRNVQDFYTLIKVGVKAGIPEDEATEYADTMLKSRQEASIINFDKALSAEENRSAILGLAKERLVQTAAQSNKRLEQDATQHTENLDARAKEARRKPSKNPWPHISQKGKNAVKAAEAEEKKEENTKKSRIKTLENTVVSLSGVLAGSIPGSSKSAKPLAKARILLSKIQGGDEQLKDKIVRQTGRSWQQVEKELEEYLFLTTTTGTAPVSTVPPEVKQEALKKVRRATGDNSDPMIQALEAKEAAGKK